MFVDLSILRKALASGIDTIRIEAAMAAVVVVLGFACPHLGSAWFMRVERPFRQLARQKILSIAVVGLITLVVRLALLPVLPIPVPSVHDEFSHLLVADTFSHGRLANPTHPLWKHFESFHITQLPTYASMYAPAPGLVLAFGHLIGRHPWVGVLLSVSAMCAGITWMLQAWLPPGWALLGGLLAAFRLGGFSYWTNGYWGGSVAAFGGALVLGALPRTMRRANFRDSVLLALGLAILANSRPYEGLLLAIPVAAALLGWIARNDRPPWRVVLRRVLLPLILVLVPVAASMGYYNWRVFGSPLTLPYRVNRAQYAVAPYFVWQSPRTEPIYRHRVMQDFYTQYEMSAYWKTRSIKGLLALTWEKIEKFSRFFFLSALLLPLVMLHRALRDRRLRFLVWALVVAAIGLLVEVFFSPHYMAPMTAMVYALLLQSMRHLRVWTWRGEPVGAALVRGTLLVCALAFCIRAAAQTLHVKPCSLLWTWDSSRPGNLERASLLDRLEKSGNRHLVIVRYGPEHNANEEWVYNEADIDSAQVVWAREMDRDSSRTLIEYFHGRLVWLLEPDLKPVRLSRYTSE